MRFTLERIPQLLKNPTTTNADLQRIIARDPGFSLAMFRAFSNRPNPPREPVTHLAHAIALLGTDPLLQAGRALPIVAEQPAGGQPTPPLRLLRTGSSCGLARPIAEQTILGFELSQFTRTGEY